MELEYFVPEEFESCFPPCKMSQMSDRLLEMLDLARRIYGRPIIINSAYRSKEYELSRGRTGTSSHVSGLAVDIRCMNSVDRLDLIAALLSAGFRRIGISRNFVHVDIDPDKVQCIWLY